MISTFNRGLNSSFFFHKPRVKCYLFCSRNIERTKIKDLFKIEFNDTEIRGYFKIYGWIKSVRTVGKNRFVFIDINDGSYFKNLQVVIDASISNYEEVLKTSTDDAIECLGELKYSIGKKQKVELCVYDSSKEHYVKLFKQINEKENNYNQNSEDKNSEDENGENKNGENENDENENGENENGENENGENENGENESNEKVHNGRSKTDDKPNVRSAYIKGSQQKKSPSDSSFVENSEKGQCTQRCKYKADYYMISKKYHTKKYLRNFPHLRARTKLYSSIFRLKSDIIVETFNYFRKKNCTYINTPILTSNDCEGGGKLFYATTLLNGESKEEKKEDNEIRRAPQTICNNTNEEEYHPSPSHPLHHQNYRENKIFEKDFFKKPCFLNVSSQLTLECLCCSMGDVFTINQSFRAENSNTFRHLNEFLMLEVELAFSNLNNIISLSEEYIKEMIKFALYKSDDIEYLNENHDKNIKKKLEDILNKKFVVITYDEAVHIVKKENRLSNLSSCGNDLSFEEQKFLTNVYFKSPVVIINYPYDIKPFYMKLNEDKRTVSCMDIIFPDVGEIVGGSEREIHLNTLKQQMQNKKLNIALYDPYLELRKYGNIPHSGFGLGIDRLIMFISSINNIRDIVPFPRCPNSLFM
ncbi:asparagine--tRNA ligase [Plasmodium brasilianum]|uniref:Asparagine--tRNA ligase n=1 Tax=Plasmodium brasilianum TaxID=5824 RepID=A0ACB9YDJ2_PLABR|nr:asparagine--tRNA ligase [Plasmodium brasilianum]